MTNPKRKPLPQIEDYNDILEQVQKRLDPQAVIAGGYARDCYLGQRPKDVDIWFHSTLHWKSIKKHIEQLLPIGLLDGVSIMVLKSLHEDAWASVIFKVSWNRLPVDFICFHKEIGERAENVLQQFDIGLCAIAWNGNKYITADEFVSDNLNNTLTFNAETRKNEDIERVVYEHLPRLLNKYPDYTPAGFPEVSQEEYLRAKAQFKVIYGDDL